MALKISINNFKQFIDSKSLESNRTKINNALYQIGANIAGYIHTQYPTPPILYGMLRGSTNIVIENNVSEYSGQVGIAKSEDRKEIPKKNQVETLKQFKDKFIVRVVFSMPYAELMHERLTPEGNFKLGPISIQAGDVGGGFIRRKMIDSNNQKNIKEDLEFFLNQILK